MAYLEANSPTSVAIVIVLFFVSFSGARNGTQGLRNARSGELHS